MDINASNHSIEALSRRMKAASDPLRLSILRLLADHAYSVMELCQITGLKQSSLSHHLKQLADTQWLVAKKQVNTIYYRRNPLLTDPLAIQLLRQLDALPLSDDLYRGCSIVAEQRTQKSKAFFDQNADAFARQTELICSPSAYADMIVQLLPTGEHALEIGPGQGELLPAIASRFTQVDAIDRSPSMVEIASKRVAQASLHNVQVLLGDEHTRPPHAGKYQLALMAMVLHHNEQPSELIAQLCNQLAPEGYLIVCDLCAHDQDWALDACGDLWLGFEEAQLSADCHKLGLSLKRSDRIALNNGFTIFVQLYQRGKIAAIQ